MLKWKKKCVRQTANFPLKKIVCLIFTLTVFAYKPLKSSLPSNQTTGKKRNNNNKNIRFRQKYLLASLRMKAKLKYCPKFLCIPNSFFKLEKYAGIFFTQHNSFWGFFQYICDKKNISYFFMPFTCHRNHSNYLFPHFAFTFCWLKILYLHWMCFDKTHSQLLFSTSFPT